jgi:hypothetical protein
MPQLAQALKLPKDLLYVTLGLLPPDIRNTKAILQEIADAIAGLHQTLMLSHHGHEEQAGIRKKGRIVPILQYVLIRRQAHGGREY